jgi:hypothetical protein
VTGLEKKVEEQYELREQVEKELRKSRQLGSTFSALESREAQPAKQSLERYGSARVRAALLLAGLGVCSVPEVES